MRNICAIIGLLLSRTVISAATIYDGTLIVTAKDVLGNPITNATVVVSTEAELSMGGHSTKYNKYRAATDFNGVARVAFKFVACDFSWDIETPSHYSAMHGWQKELIPSEVVASDYEDIDEDTEGGKAKLAELKALEAAGDLVGFYDKFGPKSVKILTNTFSRAVCFYPRRNPQPMYACDDSEYANLPCEKTTVTNEAGAVVSTYPIVQYDLKEHDMLPPYGKKGEVADFKIVHMCSVSNGVSTHYGSLEFAEGCGAYVRKQTGDKSFPSTYVAETNAIFCSKLPFSYRIKDDTCEYIQPLVAADEYAVIRTRVKTDDAGNKVECNYSKMIGEVYVGGEFGFQEIVFNPRVNDPNLEVRSSQNLSKTRGYVRP